MRKKLTLAAVSCFMAALLASTPSLASFGARGAARAGAPERQSPAPAAQEMGDPKSLVGRGQAMAGTAYAVAKADVNHGAVSAKPAITAAQMVERQEHEEESPEASLPEGPPAPPATISPPTEADGGVSKAMAEVGLQQQAPDDLVFFKSHNFTPEEVPTSQRATVLEPTAVNAGDAVFYTANWYAAKSADGGSTFTYINPYSFLPPVNGGFCCDQVTAYAPAQDMILWGLQYREDTSTGTFRLARAVGGAGLATNSWVYWDFTPQAVGFGVGDWFDYPSMTVGSSFVYITSNVFTQGGFFSGAAVMRVPLAELAAGTGFSYNYFTSDNTGTFRCTEGAATTMYCIAFANSHQIRVHKWPDSENLIYYDYVQLSYFTRMSRDGEAVSPDGSNWAARADSRPVAAYVAGGVIGVMFNARQDTDFPFPYVVHVRLSEANGALISQGQIWNPRYAFLYPTASPNASGHLAGTLQVGGGSADDGFPYPGTQVWVSDDVQTGGATVGGLHFLAGGTAGPSNNAWGDYFSVRSHKDYTDTWVVTAHTLQGGRTGSFAVPNYSWVGREKDGPGLTCPAPSPIGVGQTLDGALATTDCALGGGRYYDDYTFAGSAGQQVSVSLNSSAFDAYLYLLGPGGSAVAEGDGGGGGTNARIPDGGGLFTLPSAGTYTIRATSAAAGATGAYSLTLAAGEMGGGAGLQYYPLPSPVRLLDTRAGQAACQNPGTPLAAGSTRAQQARLTCGGVTIPASAQAIAGNATVVNNLQGAGPGFVTLYSSGASRPNVSNINYTAGQVLSNAFTVGLGAGGAFNVFALSTTDFIVDVTGYYAPPGAGGLYFHPLPRPVRLLDTRAGQAACDAPGAPIAAGTTRTEAARRTCDGLVIPDDALAVVGNATVVNNLQGSGPGFITLYPSGSARPGVSNINYTAGQVLSNAFAAGLGGDGAFKIFALSTTDLIVDVSGYFSNSAAADANGVAGLLYNPLPSPFRLLDTRPGEPACYNPGAPLGAGATRTQAARGTCGPIIVPAGALAVVGNSTVINTAAGAGFGYVTLYPSGAARPLVSNLNYGPGQVLSNHFTVSLGGDGAFQIFPFSTTHFIADVNAYYAP